jgi:hypothetical protein
MEYHGYVDAFIAEGAPELAHHISIQYDSERLRSPPTQSLFVLVRGGRECTGRVEWLVGLQALLIRCIAAEPDLAVSVTWSQSSCEAVPCCCDRVYQANLLATLWPFLHRINLSSRYPYRPCDDRGLAPVATTVPLETVVPRMQKLVYTGGSSPSIVDRALARWPSMPNLRVLSVISIPPSLSLMCSLGRHLDTINMVLLSSEDCQLVLDAYAATAERPLEVLVLSLKFGSPVVVPACLLARHTHLTTVAPASATEPCCIQYLEGPAILTNITADLFVQRGKCSPAIVQGVMVSVDGPATTEGVPVEHLPLVLSSRLPGGNCNPWQVAIDRATSLPSVILSLTYLSVGMPAAVFRPAALSAASVPTLQRLVQATRRLQAWPNDIQRRVSASNIVAQSLAGPQGSADTQMLALAVALNGSVSDLVVQALFRCLVVAECQAGFRIRLPTP